MIRIINTNLRKGVFYGLCSGFFFGLMAFIVSLGKNSVPSSQLVFFRGLSNVILLFWFVRNLLPQIFENGALWLWSRGILGSTALLCFYFNLQNTTPGTAKSLHFIGPVVLVILSWVILKERLNLKELCAIFITFLGTALILLPKSLRPEPSVIIIGLLGALMGGSALLCLRKATSLFCSKLIVWWMSLMMIVTSLFVPDRSWVLPDFKGWLIIVGVSASGLLQQLVMTLSFKYLRAAIAINLALTSMAWVITFGIIFDGVSPSPLEWLAYLFILLGAMGVNVFHNKQPST